ncbi:MAG: hypothetical protein JXR96_15600 [Deltaproteobacteria bacterium]|nr:hypothetical protein [Deltaproteobacteria bacterium]
MLFVVFLCAPLLASDPGDGARVETRVYDILRADALSVAEALEAVLAPEHVELRADGDTNRLSVTASPEIHARIELLLRPAPEARPRDGRQIGVLFLQHADAGELASVLEALCRPGPRTEEALFRAPVEIRPDGPTNSLVVIASKPDLQALKAVVARLDRPRRWIRARLRLAVPRQERLWAGELDLLDNEQRELEIRAPAGEGRPAVSIRLELTASIRADGILLDLAEPCDRSGPGPWSCRRSRAVVLAAPGREVLFALARWQPRPGDPARWVLGGACGDPLCADAVPEVFAARAGASPGPRVLSLGILAGRLQP